MKEENYDLRDEISRLKPDNFCLKEENELLKKENENMKEEFCDLKDKIEGKELDISYLRDQMTKLKMVSNL